MARASGCVTLLHLESISVAETRFRSVIFHSPMLFNERNVLHLDEPNCAILRLNARPIIIFYLAAAPPWSGKPETSRLFVNAIIGLLRPLRSLYAKKQ